MEFWMRYSIMDIHPVHYMDTLYTVDRMSVHILEELRYIMNYPQRVREL
jgi:hypothetical protein